MRKLGGFIVGLTVVAAAGYSVFWFVQAGKIKDATEHVLQKAANDVGQNGGQLTYKEITTTGFPLQFGVSIVSPSIASNDPNEPFEMRADGSIDITAPITANAISVSLPKKIDFISTKNGKNEELHMTFKSTPEIKAVFEGVNTLSFLTGNTQAIEDEYKKAFRSFSYADTGYFVVDGNGNKIYSQESFALNFTTEPKGDNRAVNFSLKAVNGKVEELSEDHDLAQQSFGIYQGLGNVNFSADFALELPQDIKQLMAADGKMEIRDLAIETDKYALKVSGLVNKANDDLFPFGKVEILVDQYATMVDLWADAFAQNLNDSLPQGASLVNFNIKDEQRAKIKNFLVKVSDNPQTEEESLKITIQREKGQMDVQIGTLNSQQARDLSEEASNDVMNSIAKQQQGNQTQQQAPTSPQATEQVRPEAQQKLEDAAKKAEEAAEQTSNAAKAAVEAAEALKESAEEVTEDVKDQASEELQKQQQPTAVQ